MKDSKRQFLLGFASATLLAIVSVSLACIYLGVYPLLIFFGGFVVGFAAIVSAVWYFISQRRPDRSLYRDIVILRSLFFLTAIAIGPSTAYKFSLTWTPLPHGELHLPELKYETLDGADVIQYLLVFIAGIFVYAISIRSLQQQYFERYEYYRAIEQEEEVKGWFN